MRPWAIYVRLSDVKGDKEAPSLDRQARICAEVLERRELPVGPTFTDAGITASKPAIHRPAFSEMMSRIKVGEFAGVIVWKLDRLTRQMRQQGPIIDALEKADALLISVTENLDMSNPIGQALAGFIVAQGAQESLNTSMRVSAALADDANDGLAKTGGNRLYGLRVSGKRNVRRIEVIPGEKKHLRKAARDIKSGLSIRETAKRLNASGSRTARGFEWTPSALARTLKSPQLRGKCPYKGRLIDGKNADGTPWPIVFSEAEHVDLVHRLDKAGENWQKSLRRKGNQHLLTGLAICGICGCRLRYKNLRGYPYLLCQKAPGYKGCGGVGVTMIPVERYVIGCVRYHGHTYVEQAEQKRRKLQDAIAEDERDLAVNERTLDKLIRDRYAVDEPLSDTMYASVRAPLVARIAELQERLAQPHEELEKLPVPSFTKGRLDVVPKDVDGREWLRRYLEAIEIMPARHRGGRFDETRIRLHWLGGTVTDDADMRTEDDDTELEEAHRQWNLYLGFE